MDRFERMVALLRSGQTAGADQLRAEAPEALLPRWTAGEPLSPALRQVRQLESLIKAVRLDDTYAWAMAGCSVHRIPLAEGEAQCVRLESSDDAFYVEAVFNGATVVAVEDERLCVWDLATGKLLLATDPDDIPRRAGRLVSLAVGVGVAVTGTEGGYLLLWDLADGRQLARTAAHSGDVFRVAISAGEAPIVLSLGGEDTDSMTLCFHDLDGLRRAGEVAVAGSTTCGGWTVLDGQRRAVTVGDGLLTVWDATAVEPTAQFPTPADPDSAPAFLAGGAWAVLGERRALRIIDLRNGTLHGTIRTDFTQRVGRVAVRGSFLFVAQSNSTEGRTNLFELADPLPQDDRDRPYFRDAVISKVDGRPVVVAVDEGGVFEVVDAADGSGLAGAAGERRIVHRAAGWSPRLVSTTAAGRDLLVVMGSLKPTTVDPATGETHTTPEPPLTPAVLHEVAARGGVIAAISIGGLLAVWDAATLTLRAAVRLELRETTSMTLVDLHGRTVVLTGTDAGGFRWFDSADLTELAPPGRFAERIDRTAPEGWDWPGAAAVRRLHVLGSVVISVVSGTVTCADIATGESIGPALAHPGTVDVILPVVLDGVPVVATACADRVLRVWDIESGRVTWSVALPEQVRRILSVTADQVVVHTSGYVMAVGPLNVIPST
ncbi:PQQ-binding-like beta-propeller repeat protein [Micromonospora sp. NBC_00617]|uniref:WD40 repeat domain-containing protein n=1 Tax=Micromonospora sp. NBC_00617 TaxID=2903587 RepID=UPI0030DF8677